MNVTLYGIVFDCADAADLAGFWASVLGRKADEGASADFAGIGLGEAAGEGPGWMFVKVPEPKTSKNRVHVDLAVADLEGEAARVVALGATQLADREEDGAHWITLADPEGNEFDLVAVGA